MKKFRKKPVVIEAFQLTKELLEQRFPSEDYYTDKHGKERYIAYHKDHAVIETLEGTMIANLNDWIIKGVNGELYPCKPDIFEKTYEPVEDDLHAKKET